MRPLYLSTLVCFWTASAIAQPAQNVEFGGERQAAREQRRVDLRNALRAGQQVDTPPQESAESVPVGRHLSVQERTEMRRQLRQQQGENWLSRP